MSDTKEQPAKSTRAIIYTDGGFEREHSVGGWGIHGYRYVDEPPKKGTGNPKAIPTAIGYAPSKDGAEVVTLTHYISGVGHVKEARSSNHTELYALTKALEYIQAGDIDHCVIYSDSETTVKGLNNYLPRWRNNGWKNSQGEPIANLELWQSTDQIMDLLGQAKKSVELCWISGHSGLFGNEMSDDWARKGNALGIRGNDYSTIEEADAQGFWKVDYAPPKLLSSGRWYFSTADLDYKNAEGHHIYYMGDNSGEDELTGKPMAENSQSIVFLKTADPVLEEIREEAINADSKRTGRLMIGRLDAICSSKIYDELRKHGTKFLKPRAGSNDLVNSSKRPILVEKKPIGLGFNAIVNLRYLEEYLNAFHNGDNFLIKTEITDLLYDKEVKKDKVVLKLSGTLGPTTKFLDLPIRYCLKPARTIAGPDDPDIREALARMIVGRDMPKRSTFADIANKEPRVFVVTWRTSDHVIRFATIVECEDGYGIWAATDSNMLYIKSTQ